MFTDIQQFKESYQGQYQAQEHTANAQAQTGVGYWGQPQHPCPSCGRCPHCGRGEYQTQPYQYPYYPMWYSLSGGTCQTV